MCEATLKQKITYKVMRCLPTSTPSYIVWEYQDAAAVNEYIAYESKKQKDMLILYPNRKLIPSSLSIEKQRISIHDTKRGF